MRDSRWNTSTFLDPPAIWQRVLDMTPGKRLAIISRAFHAIRLTYRQPDVAWHRALDLWASMRAHPVLQLTGAPRHALQRVNREFQFFFSEYLEKPLAGHTDATPFRRLDMLYALVRLTAPKTIVETGVASGFPSAVFLAALEANGDGELYSIDIGPAESLGQAVPEYLKSRWKLFIGASRNILPGLLRDLETIDVFMHDSDHTYENMMFEFSTAWPSVRKGGYLISDDIHWNRAFFDFCRKTGRRPVFINPASSGAIRK